MSNDRHLDIKDGTMGHLFRRVTLATLGLDSMEGVSEQSFEVVERADAFVERLLGGVSHVMPKVDVDRMGTKATRLSDDIYMGMSGLNGPRNATDLGDWQYWLDAVLLTLFDEEEEEEAVLRSSGYSSVNASKRQAITSSSSAVRQRVAALKASGVRPAMLQSLPADQKRAFIKELGAKSVAGKHESSVMSQAIAEALRQTLKSASDNVQSGKGFSVANSVSTFEKLLSGNSRQAFASHMADKASLVSAQVGLHSQRAEVLSLAQRWSKSIANLSVDGSDVSSVREMLSSLDGLEKAGAVTAEQAASLRRAGQSYARRVLSDEISNDVSAVAGRIAAMMERSHASGYGMLPSHRALSVNTESQSLISSDVLRRSFSALNGRLSAFNEAVSSRVMRDGDSAATVRWTRAADRFTRMQGISDEMDRVLLRDVVESAEALGAAGIVSKRLVETVTSLSQSAHVSSARTATGVGQDLGARGMAEALSYMGTSRVLGQLAGHVERSVEKLMQDISKSGMDSTAFNGFISDIRQMVATGRGGAVGDLKTSVQASSVIESICAKLDAFADMAATSVVTRGYDDLSTEGTYVSTAEVHEASASTGQSRSIRQLQQALSAVRAKSQEEAKRFVAQYLGSQQSLSQDERKILESVTSSASLESFMRAQQVMMPHLDSAARTELLRTVESVRKSHAHLESVSRQIQLIENAVKLSSHLRQAVHASMPEVDKMTVGQDRRGSQDVRVDDVLVNRHYLSALTHTLEAYAKVRDEYRVRRSDAFVDGQNNRIERMLSIVKPNEGQTRQSVSHTLSGSDQIIEFARQVGSDISFGYDEIVSDSMSVVRGSEARYPSNAAGDIGSVLGHRKAVELYASELASGNGASVHALSESLQKLASDTSKFDTIVSFGVNESGERVQLSLGVQNVANKANGYRLKNAIGDAYQPSVVRGMQQPAVNATLSLKQGSVSAVSGAEQFVSVIAGLNSSSTEGRESSMSLTQDSREAISNVLARFGMRAVAGEGMADHADDKLRLTVGGVDFDMSSHAFVQMIAKPVMSSVSHSMPSMMDANNALFAGYSSLMNARGEQRSLKTLRQLYVAEQARAGQLSAHGQVGFSTQSFADILGVNPVFINASKPVRMDSSMEMARRQAAEDLRQTTSTGVDISDDIAMRSELVSSREFANDANYAWVSHAIQAHQGGMGHVSSVSGGQQRTDSNTQQLLSRIDSMFDYVESLSERNVGVFSTDETVRVMLEALPAESSLGNKGLPKWRQRDSKAARIAEARELREALARIGASPVQGTQRFANKQYVSPNLISNQASGGAPLFSGGSDSGATPGGSANASGYSSDVLNEASIPDEDLQFIAEEVFHRIEESLCEEYQRRRSE